MMRAVVSLILVVAVVNGVYAETGLLLFEGPTSKPILRRSGSSSLSSDGMAATISSILGIPPVAAVSSMVAKQVDGVLRPDAFNKPPRAFVALHLPGVRLSDLKAVSKAVDGATIYLDQEVPGPGLAVALVAASGPQKPQLNVLEPSYINECGVACLEDALRRAETTMPGHYASMGEHLTGNLTLTSSTGDDVVLQLFRPADKLWAMEMAQLQLAGERIVKEVEGGEAGGVVFETSLVGMKALAEAYGRESTQFDAGLTALWSQMVHMHGSIAANQGRGVVFQVSALDDQLHSAASLKQSQRMSAAKRRVLQATKSLLQASSETEEEKRDEFVHQAAAIGGFLLLLYFAIASVYCLCTMDFKKDTMLYSSKKVD